MKRVIIFDFDGTFYSGKHIFDNIEPKVRDNRRKFMPRLTDQEYDFVIQKYPEWETQVSGRNIIECLYKIKEENPLLDIDAKDFWQWQEEDYYDIIIDENEIVDANYIKHICQRYPSYIVSNSSPSHLSRYMQRLGIEEKWFKDVISNHFEEFDQTKKHYYKDIMEREGVKPENVIVIGDSDIADLQPARILNMKTLLVKSVNEIMPKLDKILGESYE